MSSLNILYENAKICSALSHRFNYRYKAPRIWSADNFEAGEAQIRSDLEKKFDVKLESQERISEQVLNIKRKSGGCTYTSRIGKRTVAIAGILTYGPTSPREMRTRLLHENIHQLLRELNHYYLVHYLHEASRERPQIAAMQDIFVDLRTSPYRMMQCLEEDVAWYYSRKHSDIIGRTVDDIDDYMLDPKKCPESAEQAKWNQRVFAIFDRIDPIRNPAKLLEKYARQGKERMLSEFYVMAMDNLIAELSDNYKVYKKLANDNWLTLDGKIVQDTGFWSRLFKRDKN